MRHRRRRSRRNLVLFVVALALLVWWCRDRSITVIGTFNIRMFPDVHTKPRAVAAALAELDADAIAVQEIVDVQAFERVVKEAGDLTGRKYAVAVSPYCHSVGEQLMHLGVVYDTYRLDLLAHRSLNPPGDRCAMGEPQASMALLDPHGGDPFVFTSIHFKAGGRPTDIELRRREWTWLAAALPRLEAEFAAPAIVAGDFNSTGFLDPEHRERKFIDELVAAHDRQLPTRELQCSMYWNPRDTTRYDVSLLDHVLAPNSLGLSKPRVLGMCEDLACAPQARAPSEFHTVSDHCPVRVEWHR